MSNPPSIPSDTNLITELDVATAALLAKRAGGLELNGIKSLTPEVARELGRFQGDWLLLRGLTSLPADVAEGLLPIAQKLGIGGPDYDEMGDDLSVAHLFGDELAPSVARLLAERCAGSGLVQYTIPEHTRIGADAAALLAAIHNEEVTLTLRSIKTLDAELATSLRGCRAFLRLPNLAKITEMQARHLAEGNVSLEVEATTDMTTAAVREIVRSRGRIRFHAPDMLARHATALADAHCDLTISCGVDISEYAAEQLARAKCTGIHLYFGWVGAIDGKAALALSRSGAGEITLDCKDLSDEAAAALARFSGGIGLPNLEHLRSTPGHAALAAKLAQQCTKDSYWLNLHSIQSLDREAAQAIAETPAPSMHLGIKVLSVEVAVELSRYIGSLYMQSLECLTAEVAAILAHGKMKALHVGCKSMGCDVARIWAGHSLGDLALDVLADAVTVDVVNALASGNPIRLNLSGGSIAALVVDVALASPQLSVSLHGFKEMHGWPIALPKGGSWDSLESVAVIGDYPALAKVAGIGFTPRFPRLRALEMSKCPTVKELDFSGPAGASPVQEPPLRIEVTHCKRLEKLVIMTERFCASDLKLAALPKCQSVHLSIPDLTDLRVLANVVNIKDLGVYQSPALKSLDGVQRLKRLTHFRLEACHQIEDLRQLENLQGIEELTLEDCPGIASLDAVAMLPSLYAITLSGPTRISSLHCLRHRDDVSVSIQGARMGVPPSVIKADYDHNGVDCLVTYENAIIECHQCGGQVFEGVCSGWYQRTAGARVKRSASLDGVDYIGSAKALFSSLESDAQSEHLRNAKQRDEWYQFPELHAKVACVACGAIFDPASFGANAEDEFEAGDAAEHSESAASRPDDGMRDWSEIGAERSINVSVRHLKHMRLRFSVDRNEAERPVPEAGKCPICCEADLKLSISGRAQRETAGKFSGHVVIDRTPWSELPNCFHFDEGDEKTGGSWEWSHMPRASRDMKMSCARGCFESPVSAPEQVPHVLLASLAMYESHRAQPDLDLLAGWIGGLAKTAGKPEKLVLGAVAHIDNIDPDCVPRASESADPKNAALELCTKAKALLDQALALAKKPKTRERSRPQAKPKKEQGAGEGPLAGRVFCFTGRLEGMSRAEAEGKVKALGAATADSITKKVTDLVVGADAGSKRAKALELGLEVHDQEAFEALLRGLA